MIRIDCAWLAVQALDMRAGTDTALGRVVQVFGAAHPHHAYLFANSRANRMKVLVHDGIGIWLAARRLPPRHNSCRLLRNQEHGGGDEGHQWHVTDNHSRTGQ
jgi:hypothetical protein